jgi:cytoskeleton protein RodZ
MTEQTPTPVESTKTSTPGQLLKEARERKGLSLSDIAGKLRLSTQWIKDIEADNYRHINALVYIQGHLRSYAKQVDVAEVLS